MINITWSLFLIPLVASIIISLFFNKSPKVAKLIGLFGILSSFILSALLYIQFKPLTHQTVIESSLPWINLGNLLIEFGVLINPLSILMLLVVTGVGTLVFLFSFSYMEHEEGQSRYFAALSLFCFSMLGIILSNNLIQIFIFWELVGLSSYLLIGFWFGKKSAATAAKKAFLTTRVGDVGMMIGILLLFGYLMQHNLETFNFIKLHDIFHTHAHHTTAFAQSVIPAGVMTAIALLIFMGVMGKSAQLPLHVWLPDAMEGPTPVSALIHAATMVAAGIFLLVRLNFLFEASPAALQVIAWTGGITALIAGSIAIAQNDIKKVLAYSTLSQLGYMVLALGLSNPQAGMFHLTTHAFFKALLFLGAGSLIHAMHTQEIWDMSGQGLLKKMPITSWTFLIATGALMGLPPLSGFFSKEEIITAASNGPKPLFYMAVFVIFLTAFYMGRICTIVFFSREKYSKKDINPHEGNWQVCLPLLILVALSVMGGFLPIKSFITEGHAHHDIHHGSLFNALAFMSIGCSLVGFMLAFFLYRKRSEIETLDRFPKSILNKKYYFDEFYDALILYVQESVAFISDFFERIVIVKFAANGIALAGRQFGNILRKLQTGLIQSYALFFIMGICLLIYFYALKG